MGYYGLCSTRKTREGKSNDNRDYIALEKLFSFFKIFFPSLRFEERF